MSKLDIRLSYKNACILKHALRDKVDAKKDTLEKLKIIPEIKGDCLAYLIELGYTEEESNNTLKEFDEEYKVLFKELKEEQRALEVLTEEMINATDKHGVSWYKPSIKGGINIDNIKRENKND